jgi:nitrate reductase NapE component
MATQSKKPVTQAIVGNTKKSKSSKGLKRRTMLFVVLAILVVSIVGGLGWQKWQYNQLKAKAAGWTVLYAENNYVVYACKNYSVGGYGAVNNLTIWFTNSRTISSWAQLGVIRGGTQIASQRINVGPQTARSYPTNLFASVPLGDKFTYYNGWNTSTWSQSQIASC